MNQPHHSYSELGTLADAFDDVLHYQLLRAARTRSPHTPAAGPVAATSAAPRTSAPPAQAPTSAKGR